MADQIKIYQVLLTNIEVSLENRQCFYQRRTSLIAIDGIFLRIPNYLQRTVAVASESQFFIFLDTVLGKIMLHIFTSVSNMPTFCFTFLFVNIKMKK